MRGYSFVAVALLTLAACSDDLDVRSGRAGEAMLFGTRDAAATRGGATTRASVLAPWGDHFGVWAHKEMADGSVQTVINGYDVQYLESRPSEGGATWGEGDGLSYWSYDHLTGQTLKYWDTQARQYTFAAVVPYDKATGNVSSTTSGRLGITGLRGHYAVELGDASSFTKPEGDDAIISTNATATDDPASEYVEWRIARTNRAMSGTVEDVDALLDEDNVLQPIEGQTLSQTAEVPLCFHPLLTRVEFRIYCDEAIEEDVDLQSLTVTTVTDIATSGNYDETGTTPRIGGDSHLNMSDLGDDVNLTFAIENLYMAHTGDDAPNSKEKALKIACFDELPQPFATGLTMKATLVTQKGNTVTSSIKVMNHWAVGMHYIYYLKISLEEEIILVDVDIVKYQWREGNDIDIGGDITNW